MSKAHTEEAKQEGIKMKLPANNLTPRQREILELTSEGLVAKEVASKLYISDQTVKNHLTIIRKRLGAITTTQAVAIACEKEAQGKMREMFKELKLKLTKVSGSLVKPYRFINEKDLQALEQKCLEQED